MNNTKKTMKIRTTILVVCAITFSFFSCDRNDGDGDSMVWKAEVPVTISSNTYNVSNHGGTIAFTCRNYSNPRISVAMSGETHDFPERIFHEIEINDSHKVTTDWFVAEIVGNKLTISFEPNNESWEQLLNLTVTSGDVFYTFNFKQEALPLRTNG